MCSGGSSIDDRSVSNDIQRATFFQTTEGNVMKLIDKECIERRHSSSVYCLPLCAVAH